MEYQIGASTLRKAQPLNLNPQPMRRRETFELHALSDTVPELIETIKGRAALYEREDALNTTGLYYDVYWIKR